MSERLRSIVERMKLRPDDTVLEVGCGHGVAATFICERLPRGSYLGMDRSVKMIDAARRRNAEFVRLGRAEFIVAELEELDLAGRRFDKILAVRVGLFHRDAARGRALVGNWLAPGGELFAVYDEP